MRRGARVTITSLTPPSANEANAMTNYNIEFWRGAERIFEYEGDEYSNLDDAQHHINELLQAMMVDSWSEDWTGCRFAVASLNGETVLEVPVLTTMSAIARRSSR
jgi:hypothetical protein